MSLIARLEEELKQAMVARDQSRRDALRLILSSLRSAEKELQRPLHDDEELQVLQRERKRRLEAAEAYREAAREDLAEGEEAEAELIEVYLPAQLSDEELQAIVGDVLAETGASSQKEMGRVMSQVMPRVQGRADGKRVSAVVKEKLSAQCARSSSYPTTSPRSWRAPAT